MKGQGILINMIYGILMMPFIEKNGVNRVHQEKSGVRTNLNGEDQYYPLYRINKSEFKG